MMTLFTGSSWPLLCNEVVTGYFLLLRGLSNQGASI